MNLQEIHRDQKVHQQRDTLTLEFPRVVFCILQKLNRRTNTSLKTIPLSPIDLHLQISFNLQIPFLVLCHLRIITLMCLYLTYTLLPNTTQFGYSLLRSYHGKSVQAYWETRLKSELQRIFWLWYVLCDLFWDHVQNESYDRLSIETCSFRHCLSVFWNQRFESAKNLFLQSYRRTDSYATVLYEEGPKGFSVIHLSP